MCRECQENAGTAHLIAGAVPEHEAKDHWRLVTEHRAAKDILRAVVDLVGVEAVVRHVAAMGHADSTRLLLNKLFLELAPQGKRAAAVAVRVRREQGGRVVAYIETSGSEPGTGEPIPEGCTWHPKPYDHLDLPGLFGILNEVVPEKGA